MVYWSVCPDIVSLIITIKRVHLIINHSQINLRYSHVSSIKHFSILVKPFPPNLDGWPRNDYRRKEKLFGMYTESTMTLCKAISRKICFCFLQDGQT